MLLRMVKPIGQVTNEAGQISNGRKHYRVKGKFLELGKEAVEVPDDVAKRTLEDHPGVFEAVQGRGAVSSSELKRG